jgi:AcrR family transcriptional regulator
MSRPDTAVEPKRLRGRVRVAAILDAAALTFAEKGFDGATMTEIAARSNTAIGSLYRFFPTKELVADALVEKYGQLLFERLDGIKERADGLTAGALAVGLIGLMADLTPVRTIALNLVDRTNGAAEKREAMRNGMCARLSAILCAQNGALHPQRADSMALLLLHLMKSVPQLVDEQREVAGDLLAEARAMARYYIESGKG